MRRAIGAASFLFAVSVVPAQADMAIADYLTIVKGEAAVRPDFAVVYLAGTLDGLEAANAAARARGRAYYCPPEERTPTVLDLKPALDRLLAEAVERQRDFERYARIVTVGTVSLTALARVFPCPEAAAEGSAGTGPGG
ncbi:MAG: hypothetical protein KatS3mg117_0087 [Geminicoccaceae bacterium]|jgi:hypothetical protein|nr:MAG: hypothetical protein KatS3mg117_0087 [Geminicoccaceae bacterium]